MSEPTPAPQRVIIVDFDMPFGSILAMMVKVAIVSIPAALVLGLLGAAFAGVFVSLVGGLR